MTRPEDMDTGDLDGGHRPPAQLSGPQEFAAIVGHMLAELRQESDNRNRTVDRRLASIETALRTIADGFLEMKAERADDDVWKRKTEDRLNELEAWRKRVEAAE